MVPTACSAELGVRREPGPFISRRCLLAGDPVGFQPLVLKLIGSNSNDYWTVEYRQKDGWDQGQPNNAILIHEYKVGANPFSFLQEGGGTGNSSGGWTVGQHWIDPSAQVEVWIDSFNTQNGTAALRVRLES